MFKYLRKQPVHTVLHHTTKAKMSSGSPAKKISFGPFEVTSQVSETTSHDESSQTRQHMT